MILDVCGSTNEEARKAIAFGCPEGYWVSAREQQLGRGRFGKVWESPRGNIYLSYVTRHVSTFLPLQGALAVCGLLEPLGLVPKIKWPNDVYLEGQKCAGILCEAIGGAAIIGIGVNCVRQERMNLEALLGDVDIDVLRLELVRQLDVWVQRDVLADYEKRSLLKLGDAITWQDNGLQTGTVQGLGAEGELIVLTQDIMRHLRSQEIHQVRAVS